jgi:hypothetical protein
MIPSCNGLNCIIIQEISWDTCGLLVHDFRNHNIIRVADAYHDMITLALRE